MAHWRCIAGCGACCRLDPAQREEDLACLSDEQRHTYLAMVGEDGWCIHYDTGGRRCRIYDTRPEFCRVENLVKLFAGSTTTEPVSPVGRGPAASPNGLDSVEATASDWLDPEAAALAIASCRSQIRAEYGGRGRVMRRFERAIRQP